MDRPNLEALPEPPYGCAYFVTASKVILLRVFQANLDWEYPHRSWIDGSPIRRDSVQVDIDVKGEIIQMWDRYETTEAIPPSEGTKALPHVLKRLSAKEE